MALVVSPPSDKKRVKVYELRNNDWFDRGTGFCTGRIVNVSIHFHIIVTGYYQEPPKLRGKPKACRVANCLSPQDESKVYVESEDQPERLLLETQITKDDGYQKQQGMNPPQVHAWHDNQFTTLQIHSSSGRSILERTWPLVFKRLKAAQQFGQYFLAN